MSAQPIWSGQFLDGKLFVFSDIDTPGIVFYRLEAIDIIVTGSVQEGTEEKSPREKMQEVLDIIQEQYILKVVAMRDHLIEQYGQRFQ